MWSTLPHTAKLCRKFFHQREKRSCSNLEQLPHNFPIVSILVMSNAHTTSANFPLLRTITTQGGGVGHKNLGFWELITFVAFWFMINTQVAIWWGVSALLLAVEWFCAATPDYNSPKSLQIVLYWGGRLPWSRRILWLSSFTKQPNHQASFFHHDIHKLF